MPRGQKRDPLQTLTRAYLDPRSFVSRSGGEFLYGEDISVRRHEIWERSGEFCEEPGCNRCISEETFEMHHIKHKKAKVATTQKGIYALAATDATRNTTRIGNHGSGSISVQERRGKLKWCGRHPRRVYFDGRYCPACEILRELPARSRKKVFKRARKDKFKYFL